jgi:hypothetical protein
MTGDVSGSLAQLLDSQDIRITRWWMTPAPETDAQQHSHDLTLSAEWLKLILRQSH